MNNPMDPAVIAALDQARSISREAIHTLIGIYDGLVDSGMPDDQVFIGLLTATDEVENVSMLFAQALIMLRETGKFPNQSL